MISMKIRTTRVVLTTVHFITNSLSIDFLSNEMFLQEHARIRGPRSHLKPKSQNSNVPIHKMILILLLRMIYEYFKCGGG